MVNEEVRRDGRRSEAGKAFENENRGSSSFEMSGSKVMLPPHSSKRLARTFSVCHFLFRTRNVNNGKDCSRI